MNRPQSFLTDIELEHLNEVSMSRLPAGSESRGTSIGTTTGTSAGTSNGTGTGRRARNPALTREVGKLALVLKETRSMPAKGEDGVITATRQVLVARASNTELDDLVSATEASLCPGRPSLTASSTSCVIVEGVAACLELLRRLGGIAKPDSLPTASAWLDTATCDDPRADMMRRARRVLSETLVRYPVLMDPRIVFGTVTSEAGLDFAPVAHVLATLPAGELPRCAHGIGVERLRAFADHACVRRGLTCMAPDTSGRGVTVTSAIKGRSAFALGLALPSDDVGLSGRSRHGAIGFLVSLLELNELARAHTGVPYICDRQATTVLRDQLLQSCAAGFWSLVAAEAAAAAAATGRGGVPPSLRSDFARAMRRPNPFSASPESAESEVPVPLSRCVFSYSRPQTIAGPQGEPYIEVAEFHRALAVEIDNGIFTEAGGAGVRLRADVVAERAREAISLLVECDAVNDTRAAAIWLRDAGVGSARMASRPLPPASPESACAFLEVVHAHGAKVYGDTAPTLSRSGASSNAKSQLGEWERALQVMGTKMRMADVIESMTEIINARSGAGDGAAGSVAPGEPAAAEVRRRRMGAL